MTKTNAMRMLDSAGIKYSYSQYEYDEQNFSGVHTAQLIGLPVEQVFKTLVGNGDKNGIAVFCIPVAEELDLKKAAAISHNKKLELVHVKDLPGLTGYVRGGCSPVGMKKSFPTYFDETAILFDEISISAGTRGEQLLVSQKKLVEYTKAALADLVK